MDRLVDFYPLLYWGDEEGVKPRKIQGVNYVWIRYSTFVRFMSSRKHFGVGCANIALSFVGKGALICQAQVWVVGCAVWFS